MTTKTSALRQRRGGAPSSSSCSNNNDMILPLYDGSSPLRKRRKRKWNRTFKSYKLVGVIGMLLIVVWWRTFAHNDTTANNDNDHDDDIDHSETKRLGYKHGLKEMILRPKVQELLHELRSGITKRRDGVVTCSNGKRGVLNDDYCDCPDGRDEPNTSACSHLLVQQFMFDCGSGKLLYPSRVNDGIIDCPNGSDERLDEIKGFEYDMQGGMHDNLAGAEQ